MSCCDPRRASDLELTTSVTEPVEVTTFLGRSRHRVIKIDTDVLGVNGYHFCCISLFRLQLPVNAAYTVLLLTVVDHLLPGAGMIYTLVVSGQRFRKMKNVRRKFGQLKKVSYLWRNKMRPVAVVIYFSEYSE